MKNERRRPVVAGWLSLLAVLIACMSVLPAPARAATLGGQLAALLQATGTQNVYVRGANGRIYTYVYTTSSNQWHLFDLQELERHAANAAGDPAAVLQPNGDQNVYFRDTNDSIKTYVYCCNARPWALYDFDDVLPVMQQHLRQLPFPVLI